MSTSSHTLSDFIPDHLKPFIAHQDASLYTPIDHASWRFILRISKSYFSKHAHQKYLSGLEETGISTERIPLIEEMDQKLKKFGWRAVAVSGFIPPAVFMEFQSLGILPIACEMRTLEHLAYTPAPDIVHEAAGHAPIIADPEYSEYLKNYGEVSRKAIFSSQDLAVYEAVRNLSDIKENPQSTPEKIQAAQTRLDQTTASVSYISEATLLARMNWWTVEYGLVGDLRNPKIYGAGLLSSVGESYQCLKSHVKKIPLTIDAVQTLYDITRPQPQLFVTPHFKHLTDILIEFSQTMAFKKGGIEGLAKALQAQSVCTSVLDTGIQISGVLSHYDLSPQGKIAYLKFTGPTQLSTQDQEIKDHGPSTHKEGFSTFLGRVKNPKTGDYSIRLSELSDSEIKNLGPLHFESGITLAGDFIQTYRSSSQQALILSFKNCTVTGVNQETLFDPSWGTLDLAWGESVTSVFGGAADRKKYLAQTGGFQQVPQTPKCNLTHENKILNQLYSRIRELREQNIQGTELESAIILIQKELKQSFKNDWLSRLEILELVLNREVNPEWKAQWSKEIQTELLQMEDPDQLIQRGLSLNQSEVNL